MASRRRAAYAQCGEEADEGDLHGCWTSGVARWFRRFAHRRNSDCPDGGCDIGAVGNGWSGADCLICTRPAPDARPASGGRTSKIHHAAAFIRRRICWPTRWQFWWHYISSRGGSEGLSNTPRKVSPRAEVSSRGDSEGRRASVVSPRPAVSSRGDSEGPPESCCRPGCVVAPVSARCPDAQSTPILIALTARRTSPRRKNRPAALTACENTAPQGRRRLAARAVSRERARRLLGAFRVARR